MERELWKRLYCLVVEMDNGWTNGFYRAAEIVAVYLWAVVHDRPTCWACDPSNWHGDAPPRLPPQCTVSRRLRSRGVRDLLKRVEQRLRGDPRRWWVQRIDSKPLPLGLYSKDPDARLGRCGRGFSLGYKLHAVWGDGPIPSLWSLEPMNVGDSVAARTLLNQLEGEGYVVGDKQYDSNPLHRVAAPRHQVVAAQQLPGAALGHRKHHPSRVHAVEMLGREFGQALLKERTSIERNFGNLTNHATGLSPLPSWVRRIERVTQWVQAKLLLHATRLLLQPMTAPA